MTTYDVPIGTLFDILGLLEAPYEEAVTTSQNVDILSPSGEYVPVRAWVRKHVPASIYEVGNTRIVCADKHLIQENGTTTRISEAQTADTLNGNMPVRHIQSLGEIDVFDVALDAPHLYATPNGIIHHNTTLARVLAAELKIEDSDFLYINASRDNGVDLIRDRITRFASTIPWGEFKIILLDEADYISPAGQAALRGVMEEYANVVRFILTCNYPNRIIDAIKSRSQSFHISNQDQTDFTTRVAEILLTEGVEFELETLDDYVKATYPDLRKTINAVEQNVTDGKLVKAEKSDDLTTEWKLRMIALFREGKLREARKLICANATLEDFDDMYRFLFDNIEFFGEDTDTQDAAVVIIRNGKYKSHLVGDQEIAFSATVIELENLSR